MISLILNLRILSACQVLMLLVDWNRYVRKCVIVIRSLVIFDDDPIAFEFSNAEFCFPYYFDVLLQPDAITF